MHKEMGSELKKLQFLGILGIFWESYKIIYTWRKLFFQLTLTFIFPLSLVFLARNHIPSLMLETLLDETIRHKTLNSNPKLVNTAIPAISPFCKWVYFFLLNTAYSFLISIVSLPSTAAVAYAVASISTARQVSFNLSFKVIAKVWKPLLLTSFYILAFSFVYESVVGFFIFIVFRVIIMKYGLFIVPMLVFFMVLLLVGTLYLSVIWQLSKAVSVFEEAYGFKAMVKSQRMLKGKMMVAISLLFLANLPLVIIQYLWKNVVVHGIMRGKGFLGIVCFLLLLHFLLVKVVLLTMLYLLCKSYRGENDDLSALLDDLSGQYVPLKPADDVQLEGLPV